MRLNGLLRGVPLLLLICWTSGIASAEVALVSSDPKNGAVVAHAPKAITLHFSGTINPSKTRLNLSNLSGRMAPALPKQPKSSAPTDTLTVIMPILNMGSYVLYYKVVGTDGKPAHGRVSFTAGGY